MELVLQLDAVLEREGYEPDDEWNRAQAAAHAEAGSCWVWYSRREADHATLVRLQKCMHGIRAGEEVVVTVLQYSDVRAYAPEFWKIAVDSLSAVLLREFPAREITGGAIRPD